MSWTIFQVWLLPGVPAQRGNVVSAVPVCPWGVRGDAVPAVSGSRCAAAPLTEGWDTARFPSTPLALEQFLGAGPLVFPPCFSLNGSWPSLGEYLPGQCCAEFHSGSLSSELPPKPRPGWVPSGCSGHCP